MVSFVGCGGQKSRCDSFFVMRDSRIRNSGARTVPGIFAVIHSKRMMMLKKTKLPDKAMMSAMKKVGRQTLAG